MLEPKNKQKQKSLKNMLLCQSLKARIYLQHIKKAVDHFSMW